MSRIRLYFDEDAMQNALVVALRARHIDVLSASDCGMVGRSERKTATEMGSRLEYLSAWDR